MSEVVAGAGVVVAAGAAAAAILLPAGGARAAAMLAALALFPLLILGDQWSSAQISDLRDEPAGMIALALVATLALVLLLAAAFHRRPILLPLAIVAALPFRVPLEAGGDTANLLVPLYLVIAGGVLASAARDWRLPPAGPLAGDGAAPSPSAGDASGQDAARPEGPATGRSADRTGLGGEGGGGRPGGASDQSATRAGGVGVGGPPPPAGCGGEGSEPASASSLPPEQREGQGGPPTPTTGPARRAATWLPRVLAAVVVLYALQTLYSPDFSKSLQNVCFFFVPFSLAYALLRGVEWNRRLLVLVLWVIAIEAVAFVVVGSAEYATRGLFWNDQVIRSNEFHTYFRVNSVFWDPNVYGRYLALAITIAMAALLWARERRSLALLTALVAILWLGLVPTFSQSGFVALLAGLAVLAALRWSLRWIVAAVAVGAVLAVVTVLFAGGVSKLSPDRLNVETGGRSNLVSGGAKLFGQRPLWGYGAGSFPRAYREHAATEKAPVAVSHTQPITIAAEQGLLGLAAYLALLIAALWTLATGLRSSLSGYPVSRAGGGVAEGAVAHAGQGGEGGGGRPGAASCFSPLRLSGRERRSWRRTQRAGGHPHPPPTTGAVGRAAVLAAFVALLVHTMAYAGFFEDPIAWVLLAVGASLAAVPVRNET